MFPVNCLLMLATFREGSLVCCNPNVSRLAILLSTLFFIGASLALFLQKPVCPVYTCTRWGDLGPCSNGTFPIAININGNVSIECGVLDVQ